MNAANRSEILNEYELKRIEYDLKQPIERTQEQQKEILQKQETDLLLLSSVIEGRNDIELIKRIISSGIVESFLLIFTKRDLNSITRTYLSPLFDLTNNSSDEVKLLIAEKKPYPGLIRLLEHTNNNIAGDAIVSIFNIQLSGTNTTKESDPHPHYESIQESDGIKKIFALFQKNKSKYSRDRSAISLGYLFRAREITDPIMRQEIINHIKSLLNDDDDDGDDDDSDAWVKETAKNALKYLAQNDTNRSEILNEQELKKIEQDLKQPIEGTQEQQKNITQRQETDLLLLSLILEGQNDNELRKRIISSGIVENLLFIFTNKDQNPITLTYSNTFYDLTNPSSDEVCLLLAEQKPFPGLIRLIVLNNINVVTDAINSIVNILNYGTTSTPESDPHPHFEAIQECDGIKKIFALFHRDDASKDNKDTAMICLGYLFHAQEITDEVMRHEIISHLKTLINDPDSWTQNNVKDALKDLALNAVNKAEIEADGFTIPDQEEDGEDEQ
ncbi:MAG: hypothetical protein EZS28_032096 [Streblomastix strix]|uniref:Uncharacterized protein n=1 Tax=Streblomastix strix TaxID=222440 RepID=A0A5J4UPK9_9EUKA|nr:MAG: hypothetical protein EZS28_032096 [Streblomastix strix]